MSSIVLFDTPKANRGTPESIDESIVGPSTTIFDCHTLRAQASQS